MANRILGTLLAVGFALSAHAQAPPSPSGTRLVAGTDTLFSFLIQGADTVPTGRVIDDLQFVDFGGRKAIQRVYRSENQLSGGSLDTLVDDFASVGPVRQHSRSLRAIELIEFEATRATGTIVQANGNSLQVDVSLKPPFYSSSSFDLVLRSSQLSEGWAATVPAFVTSSRVVVPMNAKVVAAERIDGVLCWRIDAEFTGMPVTFWVAQEGRRLMRQEMRPRARMTLLYRRASRASRSVSK